MRKKFASDRRKRPTPSLVASGILFSDISGIVLSGIVLSGIVLSGIVLSGIVLAQPASFIIISSVRSGWARSHSGRRPRIGGTPCVKFSTGGGEVVAHSSVHAFHGLSPASLPERSEISRLTMKISTENASKNAPIVESMFIAAQPG